jgi:hypothetical protein
MPGAVMLDVCAAPSCPSNATREVGGWLIWRHMD